MSHKIRTHTFDGKPDEQTIVDFTTKRPVRGEQKIQMRAQRGGRNGLFIRVDERAAADFGGGDTFILTGADLGAVRDLLATLPEEAFHAPTVWTDGDTVKNQDSNNKVRVRIGGRWFWVNDHRAPCSLSDESATRRSRLPVDDRAHLTVLLNQASVTA